MDKYNIYDNLVALTLKKFYNMKENNIPIIININKSFFSDKISLYYYEIAKMAQSLYNIEIIINSNILNYIIFKKKFKIKKYGVEIKRKKLDSESTLNNSINKWNFLYNILIEFNEINKENKQISMDIYKDIYNAYYNIEKIKKEIK